MDITDPRINDYLLQITPPRSTVLEEMEHYARENDFPIIGPLVGSLLQQLVLLTSARRIFEMGSGYGYSAMWFATAMPPDGRVECTEADEGNIHRGVEYARRAEVGEKIIWHHGDALDILHNTAGQYDIILNDVHKEQYPRALEIAWQKLRRGGVLVTDNTLWSGRIIEENPPSEATAGILRFNKLCYELPDALCTLLPLRDGVMLTLKV